MRKTIVRGLVGLLLCWGGTSQATPTADARAVHAHGVVQGSTAVSPDGGPRSPSIPNHVILAQAVVAATIVLGAVALVFLIGYSGTPTIPPTNETTARLYGFSIFWITLSALALLNAYLVLDLIGHTGASPARVAAGAFLLLPALSNLGAYGLAHRRLLARLRSEASPDRDEPADSTPALIQQLRREMAIRRPVNVLTMRQANRSPYVFSSLWGPAWLVLPANFDAMTRQGLVIMGAILLTIVVFSVATDILAGIGRPDLPLFPALRLSGPFSQLAILLAGTLLLACMNLKWSVLANDVHRFLLMLFPELLSAFVPWVVILVFFRSLPMQTRFFLMLFQALLAGVLMNSVFMNRMSREAYVRAEWLEYDRLLWWRRLYTRSPYDAVETHRTIGLHLRKGFFNYALPGLLLAAVLYPWLCHQDSWFLAHQGEVAAKVSEWSNLRPSGWAAFRDYFWPYLMLSAAQNNLPVSAGILLLAICLSFPCLFIVLGFSMVINSNTRWTIIERVPLLDRISKLTGDQLVGDAPA